MPEQDEAQSRSNMIESEGEVTTSMYKVKDLHEKLNGLDNGDITAMVDAIVQKRQSLGEMLTPFAVCHVLDLRNSDERLSRRHYLSIYSSTDEAKTLCCTICMRVTKQKLLQPVFYGHNIKETEAFIYIQNVVDLLETFSDGYHVAEGRGDGMPSL